MRKFMFCWRRDGIAIVTPELEAKQAITECSKRDANDLAAVDFEKCREFMRQDAEALVWLYSAKVGDYFEWRDATIVRLNSKA